MNASIVIPVFNEEHTLGQLLKKLNQLYKNKYEIIVVDDGSTDRTPEIAKKYNVKLLQKENGGKGTALREGFKAAKNDIIVMMDADLSHKPEDIPVLLKPLEDKKIGVVIASRSLGGSEEYVFFRAIGNIFLSNFSNYFIGTSVFDVLNGFKALRKSITTGLKCRGFEIEIEIVAAALRNGLNVVEVPSQELARAGGNVKSFAIREGFLFFKQILVEGIKLRLRL